jgi:hypothetical protein
LSAPAALARRLPRGGPADAEAVLDRFLDWMGEQGLTAYPAQEEAFLELVGGRHVILATPTGSGKSMVAALLHFKAMAEWRRSFYTAPTKALTSEKFFWLCNAFGPENVGMLTGDAAINADAPIICCTTEVLANTALRRGRATPAPYVCMDEFHYYGDRDRGMAWQVPLLELRDTTFLLMSGTLGDTRKLSERLRAATGREVAEIVSVERPVPLDYTYRETPLQETVEELLDKKLAPIYIVHFTQREAAEQAQALTSARICDREQRDRIAEAIGKFRFDTAYGKEFKRFLNFGIGVHHAGLLPRHRLLVEQLAQKGLLRVICGTDTLGVGVNIPIRTVVFSQLSKYDGEKVGILSVREFHQIAGRAGRRGFDEQGSVVCQAPEHVIENKRTAARDANRGRKPSRKRGPPPNFVAWNDDVFQKLIHRAAEPLPSRFRINHGAMIYLLQRDDSAGTTGYPAIADLIGRSHETPVQKGRLLRESARIFRSLRRAGIVEVVRDADTGRRRVRVGAELQDDFSLHHTFSLYLVDAIAALDPSLPEYALDVLTLVEAILENPMAILLAQQNAAKGALVDRLKAEGVPFEERMRQLEDVTWPRPNADFIEQTFDIFCEKHPWLADEEISPKSIAREMYEDYSGFTEYVRRYEIARIEGRLLRYLGDVHRTLVQNVPEHAKTDELEDVIAFFWRMLNEIDSSLFDEWAGMRGLDIAEIRLPEREPFDLARHPKVLTARVRADLHRLVRLLSTGDWEGAAQAVRQVEDDRWDAARFEEALAPFLAEHGKIVFTPRARLAEFTRLDESGPRRWAVSQVLLDPSDDNFWAIEGEVDLRDEIEPEGSLVRMRRIGP